MSSARIVRPTAAALLPAGFDFGAAMASGGVAADAVVGAASDGIVLEMFVASTPTTTSVVVAEDDNGSNGSVRAGCFCWCCCCWSGFGRVVGNGCDAVDVSDGTCVGGEFECGRLLVLERWPGVSIVVVVVVWLFGLEVVGAMFGVATAVAVVDVAVDVGDVAEVPLVGADWGLARDEREGKLIFIMRTHQPIPINESIIRLYCILMMRFNLTYGVESPTMNCENTGNSGNRRFSNNC